MSHATIQLTRKSASPCESGGIGRRTRLRIWRSNPWGVESPLSHQHPSARPPGPQHVPPPRPTPAGVIWRNYESIRAAASNEPRPESRLPRVLRQQRPDPGQRLGLPTGLRPGFPRRPRPDHHPQPQRDLPQPAAGQGSVQHAGAASGAVRAGLRRAQSGAARPQLPAGAYQLTMSYPLRWRSLIPPRLAAPLPAWIVFSAICAALCASHLTLLRLPYYWDEAGYYIPAAWDFFSTGSL